MIELAQLQVYLSQLKTIVRHVGEITLNFYHQKSYQVYQKQDDTPVTDADHAANDYIVKQLAQLTPNIPIISEENPVPEFKIRQNWPNFWLIDPLDGTKEFIHHTGDFSINIALVSQGVPVLGIVYVPINGDCYYAIQGQGAFKNDQPIHTKKLKMPMRVIVSRRLNELRIAEYIGDLFNYQLVKRGSSLKTCLVAEGVADYYPCVAPTREWDTAAGQCILTEAGGKVFHSDLSEMRYNTHPSLRNPALLIVGDTDFDWQSVAERMIFVRQNRKQQ